MIWYSTTIAIHNRQFFDFVKFFLGAYVYLGGYVYSGVYTTYYFSHIKSLEISSKALTEKK